jgi:hypothetical protein
MEHEVQPPSLQFQFISIIASVAPFRITTMICLMSGQLAMKLGFGASLFPTWFWQALNSG